jgi:hypothetical protein
MATGLFLFNNAPSHQKHAPDAPSAQKMPKNPNKGWTHVKDGPRMCPTSFTAFHPPMTEPGTFDQELYFPDNHPEYPGYFKGMECIIHECSLWLKTGLLAQYEKFKCKPGQTSCCCQQLLFMQPDFTSHKSQLKN